MNRQLNCAVIGCGVIAPAHVESYQLVPDTTVLWACDLIPEKTANIAGRHGIPRTTTDYREAIADPQVDAISICTDHASHADIAVAALAAGKHVLCEKALAAVDVALGIYRSHREGRRISMPGN